MLRFTLGKLYLDAKETERATGHLKHAVVQDSMYSAAWKLLGKTHVQAGRSAEARRAFERGIAAAEEKGDKQSVKEMQVFLRRLDKTDKGDGQQ